MNWLNVHRKYDNFKIDFYYYITWTEHMGKYGEYWMGI